MLIESFQGQTDKVWTKSEEQGLINHGTCSSWDGIPLDQIQWPLI